MSVLLSSRDRRRALSCWLMGSVGGEETPAYHTGTVTPGGQLPVWGQMGSVLKSCIISVSSSPGGLSASKPICPVARPATLVADSQKADHVRRNHVIEVVGETTKNLASDATSMDYRRGFGVSQDKPDASTDFLLKAPSNRRRCLVPIVTSGFKKVGSSGRMKLPTRQAGRGARS
jgi:hypothetical protein